MGKRYIKISMIIMLIGLLTLFFVGRKNNNVSLADVELQEENNKNSAFAIMLEEIDGEGNETYKQSESNTFPANGYILNEEKTSCIDMNGKKLENAIIYENGNLRLRINGTSYCYLYFDLGKTYILMAPVGSMPEYDTKITNILKEEGNFEKEDDFYPEPDNGDSTHCETSTDIYKYGKRACKVIGKENRPESFIRTGPFIKLDNTHIYYTRVEYFLTSDSSYQPTIDIYWPMMEEPSILTHNSLFERNRWGLVSGISDRSSFENGSYNFRIDFNNENQSAEIIYDGAMLIDLTESYGESYPAIDYLDKLMYFDNTVEIKEQFTNKGIFPLNNSVNNIICDNDAVTKIENNVVTIDSSHDYTICQVY